MLGLRAAVPAEAASTPSARSAVTMATAPPKRRSCAAVSCSEPANVGCRSDVPAVLATPFVPAVLLITATVASVELQCPLAVRSWVVPSV